MPNPALGNITADITQATTVTRSATVLVNSIAGRIDAAVAKALENGATDAELQPISALSDELEAASNELAAAVTANTPAPPEPPVEPPVDTAAIRAAAGRRGR